MGGEVLVVINPVAGGRSRLAPARRLAIARDALAAAGVRGEVVLTERAGHARDLARAAADAGLERVIAWGGDGTINEVAAALIGRRPALGIVRAGSGNGLARELGIPTRPEAALSAALAGGACEVDTGEIDGRPFVNVAGIGLDAAMAARFCELGTDRRGALRYTAAVARGVFAYRPAEYEIQADGERWQGSALLLAVANMPQYGSNAVIAPRAVPFDGWLDLVVIGSRGALGRIGLVPRLFDRTIHKAPGVRVSRVRQLAVSSSAPMVYHVDGEPVTGGTRIEVRVLPGSLHLCGIDPRRLSRLGLAPPGFSLPFSAGILPV